MYRRRVLCRTMTALLRDRRVALAGIVLLAVGLRLAGLGDRLSADEGFTWLVASAPSPDAFLDRLAAYENTPPLYYLLVAPLPLGHEAWLRLPSLVAGVACVPVLYALVRPLLGTPAALLSALALAVAPYAVSFSNYARGFELATLGLLLALWAAARLAQRRGSGWWSLYLAGCVLALYSEYYAVLALLAIVAVLLVLGVPRRLEAACVGLLPLVALGPFAGQIVRSIDAVDKTKVAPIYPDPGPRGIRDALVPLAFGEHGAASAAALRYLQALLVVGVGAAAAAWLWRRSRVAFWLIAGTALGTLLLHALAAIAGVEVFAARYLTVLVPLGAALLGSAAAAIPWRYAAPAFAVVLLGLGAAVFLQRVDRELEPNYAPVRAAVEKQHPRVVLVNSAVAAYYLRDLHPVLDRPFGLRPLGAPLCCGARHLKRSGPVVVVDDARVAGGVRREAGPRAAFGPIVAIVEFQR